MIKTYNKQLKNGQRKAPVLKALCIGMKKKIKDIILSGKTHKDLPRVLEELGAFSEKELFENLFPVSVEQQEVGKGVAFSAYALNELNPQSSISIEGCS